MKGSLSQILYPSVVSADRGHISFGVSVERSAVSILFLVTTILHCDDDYYDY